MEKTKPLLFFILFLFKSVSGGDDECLPATCGLNGPQVRFPFHLRDRQPSRCGYPGLDLSCNNKNQTLLTLSSSQSPFIVKRINYAMQMIAIEPDHFCRPEGIVDFRLTNTPFYFSRMHSYTFFNCSPQTLRMEFNDGVTILPFPCVNHSLFAVRAGWVPHVNIPASCRAVKTISVPNRRLINIWNELTLVWLKPDCISCGLYGGTCGFTGDDGEIACFNSSLDGKLLSPCTCFYAQCTNNVRLFLSLLNMPLLFKIWFLQHTWRTKLICGRCGLENSSTLYSNPDDIDYLWPLRNYLGVAPFAIN